MNFPYSFLVVGLLGWFAGRFTLLVDDWLNDLRKKKGYTPKHE